MSNAEEIEALTSAGAFVIGRICSAVAAANGIWSGRAGGVTTALPRARLRPHPPRARAAAHGGWYDVHDGWSATVLPWRASILARSSTRRLSPKCAR
jgi:hypothetical protein